MQYIIENSEIIALIMMTRTEQSTIVAYMMPQEVNVGNKSRNTRYPISTPNKETKIICIEAIVVIVPKLAPRQ